MLFRSPPAVFADTGSAELVTVSSLDLPRYMGTWHELAHFPNRFQRKCVGETSAEYSVRDDGSVRVVNRCRTKDGNFDEAEGVAHLVGGEGSPKLKVRFAPWWLSMIPAVWGDYWVIDIDPAYQVVAVGEPGREYLWVLTRGQPVTRLAYTALLSRLEGKGYDTSKLVLTAPLAP